MLSAVPLVVVTVVFIGIFVNSLLSLELDDVRKNFGKRRCEMMVILAAQKIPTDPSVNKTDFAMDNFSFCMNKLIDDFLIRSMKKVFAVFQKEVSAASTLANSMNTLKGNATSYMNPLKDLFRGTFNKFTSIKDLIEQKFFRMRFSFERIYGIMISSLYSLISLMVANDNILKIMINSIVNFLLLLIALIIILIFTGTGAVAIAKSAFLWPAVYVAITTLGLGTSTMGGIAGGLCVAPTTLVAMEKNTWKCVKEVVPGDVLASGAVVEGVLHGSSKHAKFYSIYNTIIADSHLVFHNNKWIFPADHPDAIPFSSFVDSVYCLNTSDRLWKVKGDLDSDELMLRDWEELPSSDSIDSDWETLISELLNSSPIHPSNSFPGRGLLSQTTSVFVRDKGPTPLLNVCIGDFVKDNDEFVEVLGVYRDSSGPSNALWVFDSSTQQWIHPSRTFVNEKDGMQLLTSSGCFTIDSGERVRDFSEVGLDRIHETYPFTQTKL